MNWNKFAFFLLLAFYYVSCQGNTINSETNQVSEIRIMSYNIRIAHPPSEGWAITDIAAIAKVINKNKPDLIALQEVDVFTQRSGVKTHQAKELARLTGLNYHFAKALDRSEGDYGVAILSRFPIIKSESYRLPVNEGSKGEIRAAAVIKVAVTNNTEVVFISAHLDHLSDSDRTLQIKELKKIMAHYSDYPIIFGADLNMTPDNKVINLLKEGLTEACQNHPLTFPADKPFETIDYIMLNNLAVEKFKVISYKTINETYASDHLPLIAVLRVK